MTTPTTEAGAVVPFGNLFADESPVPQTDAQALAECVGVLDRIMRDDLLCGAGTIRLVDGQIERPLYGCARRALDHAKARLANNAVRREMPAAEGDAKHE